MNRQKVLKELYAGQGYELFEDIPNEIHEIVREELTELEAKERARFSAITSVYQLTDRVLTNRDLEVEVTTSEEDVNGAQDSVAWSDGQKITFNLSRVTNLSDEDLISLNGLNYHELSHIIYTPRSGSELVTRLAENNLITAFNMLDDQRIESLMSARYPATIPYFTKAFLEYVLDSGDIAGVFPLARGRKFLPLELRQEIATRFASRAGIGITRKVANIIDEYRNLVLPADQDRAFDLIKEYASILNIKDKPKGGEGGEGGDGENGTPSPDGDDEGVCRKGGCSGRKPMRKGRIAPKQDQENAVTKSQSNDKDSGDELDDLTDLDNFAPQNEGENDEVMEKINKEITDIINNSEVKKDIERVRNSIKEQNKALRTIRKASFLEVEVEPEDSVASNKFAQELEQLRIDLDSRWSNHHASGRVNIKEAMNFNVTKIDRLFDRWNPSENDVLDIESVILTDISGSMASDIKATLRSTWVIKRALEAIDGKVTGYLFNHKSFRLFDSSEKAQPRHYRAVNATGSTNPEDALVEARDILTASTAKTRILFIITDGIWDYANDSDRHIKALREKGVITVLVFLGDSESFNHYKKYAESEKEFSHNCEHVHAISKPKQLVEVARLLVTNLNKLVA